MAHTGSRSSELSKLEVGERMYVETTEDTWQTDMRMWLIPRHRRSKELRDADFEASAFTCVPARGIGNIRYLICIERTR